MACCSLGNRQAGKVVALNPFSPRSDFALSFIYSRKHILANRERHKKSQALEIAKAIQHLAKQQ